MASEKDGIELHSEANSDFEDKVSYEERQENQGLAVPEDQETNEIL